MQANVIRTALIALRILIIALGCIWVVSAINSDDPNWARRKSRQPESVHRRACACWPSWDSASSTSHRKLATQPKRAMGA